MMSNAERSKQVALHYIKKKKMIESDDDVLQLSLDLERKCTTLKLLTVQIDLL